MSIINARNVLQSGNGQAGRDSIQINRTYTIHLLEKQKEKEAKMVFKIKQLAFAIPAPDPFLLIILFL
jgi:hypothetical protein